MLLPICQKNYALAGPVGSSNHCTGRFLSSSPATRLPLMSLELRGPKFLKSANGCVFSRRGSLLAESLVEISAYG